VTSSSIALSQEAQAMAAALERFRTGRADGGQSGTGDCDDMEEAPRLSA
jgi:hypothetical protein